MVSETCLLNLPFFARRSVSSPQDGCLFRARFANRFGVQFWIHFGSILGPKLASKRSQKARAILRPFLTPFLDQCWTHFGTNLDTCWCHFGELCVASTASADMSKTIKNQWFFNDFAMSEVSENNEKPSRGEAAPGLSAQLADDIKIGPILVPQWYQNWSQNGVRNGLKICSCFWAAFWAQTGPKNDPKLVPK